MKNIVKSTVVATLVAGTVVVATPQQHQHEHVHARKHIGSKAQKRDTVVTWVDVVDTVYQLEGKVVDPNQAKKGLEDGSLVVVGETTPTFKPPPPPAPTTTVKASVGAQFFESKTMTTIQASSAPQPSPTSVAVAPPESSAGSSPSSSSGSGSGSGTGSGTGSGAIGLNAEFPSGQIPCSTFPSQYGAVALDWLGLDGWCGIQSVPGYRIGMSSINEIHTGISGTGCVKNAMCSYACPPGYQKTQWPSAQGANHESVGGLFCNSEGLLELTRDGYNTLCEAGAGGVTIENNLPKPVATCRTDYPGTENMVIPTLANPGETIVLTNPQQSTYYQWNGKSTSAQYYVNPMGLGVEDACCWTSKVDPLGAGNWAPINIGVSMTDNGLTYLSIFRNLPTSNAKLNFNIEIIGDVTVKCSLINGVFSNEGQGNGNGCTTAVVANGKATFRYFE